MEEVMSRLIVSAFSEDTIAAPNNRQPNYIVVSVTDVNGVPVPGLGVPNFKVNAMIVGPGGALVDIPAYYQEGYPASILSMLYLSGEKRGRRVYTFLLSIFAVAAESGSAEDRRSQLA
jgi:hypothetical protein